MKIFETISEHIITQLLKVCKQELELDHLPPIDLVDEPFLQSGEKKSFGEFDGESIRVVIQGRHPMDVCRTLAHELVHWKQQLEQQEMDGEDGSETENAANAIAAIIMRKFGEQYPDFFIQSLPN